MSLIDRHVLSQCLQALGLALAAIVGLLLLQNIYDNLKDLVEFGASEGDIALYYLVLIPSFLPTVMPLAFLISILFGLGQLHRNNEIAAMRACGLGLWRITRSIWWMGAALTLLLFYLNAQLVPWSVEKAQHIWEGYAFAKQLKESDEEAVGIVRGLAYYNHAEDRLWFLNRFSQYNYRGYGITVSKLDEQGREVWRVTANEGFYDDIGGRHWVLIDGRQLTFDPELNETVRNRPFEREAFPELVEDPVLMKLREQRPNDLSFNELQRVLDTSDPVRDPDRLGYLVRYYSMAANPVICLVVVGLGVPFATSGVRVNPMVGMTKAMVLFFAFFAMANVVSILGSQGRLPALWAAWLPTILAAALGLWLMRRARFS